MPKPPHDQRTRKAQGEEAAAEERREMQSGFVYRTAEMPSEPLPSESLIEEAQVQ